MSPNVNHQKLSRRMEFELIRFVETNRLGEVFDAPLDVHLSEGEVRQPDLFYIAHANRSIIRDRIFGVPDLVMEILTEVQDYHELKPKREAYEAAGVRELWIVDGLEKTIEVLVNNGREFTSWARVHQAGPVRSKLLPGFGVIVENVF